VKSNFGERFKLHREEGNFSMGKVLQSSVQQLHKSSNLSWTMAVSNMIQAFILLPSLRHCAKTRSCLRLRAIC
jgi:hypothetical protein